MCKCINERKKDLALVRDLAQKASLLIEENIRIFRRGEMYEFEPESFNPSGKEIIEIIEYKTS